MVDRPHIRLVESQAFERPVRLRLPFRFGAATLREARQAFLKVRIEDEKGRSSEGYAAELMVPKWFDKSPELSNADNEDQLRQSLFLALDVLASERPDTAFGLHSAVEDLHHRACASQGLNALIASFGLALADRAILDALLRMESLSVAEGIAVNLPGIDASTTPDLAHFHFDDFLSSLRPAKAIALRHTVGLVDAIEVKDIAPDARLNDGLPESLEEAIDHYGLTYFKLKVSGDVNADIDRLSRIATLLDRKVGTYQVTLDGNEQFSEASAVEPLLARLQATPHLAKLWSAIQFIEQPIARASALQRDVRSLARFKPLEIDESDGTMGAFATARTLGYDGISSKSCKGFYRALLNRARIEAWGQEDGRPYFMSAEDLTTQAGLAVQQDLALAALIGMSHVERNGHHYVDGMAGASPGEQRAFVMAHGDLYDFAGGRLHLKATGGMLSLTSVIGAPGLGAAALPDVASMATMSPGRTRNGLAEPFDQSGDHARRVGLCRGG